MKQSNITKSISKPQPILQTEIVSVDSIWIVEEIDNVKFIDRTKLSNRDIESKYWIQITSARSGKTDSGSGIEFYSGGLVFRKNWNQEIQWIISEEGIVFIPKDSDIICDTPELWLAKFHRKSNYNDQWWIDINTWVIFMDWFKKCDTFRNGYTTFTRQNWKSWWMDIKWNIIHEWDYEITWLFSEKEEIAFFKKKDWTEWWIKTDWTIFEDNFKECWVFNNWLATFTKQDWTSWWMDKDFKVFAEWFLVCFRFQDWAAPFIDRAWNRGWMTTDKKELFYWKFKKCLPFSEWYAWFQDNHSIWWIKPDWSIFARFEYEWNKFWTASEEEFKCWSFTTMWNKLISPERIPWELFAQIKMYGKTYDISSNFQEWHTLFQEIDFINKKHKLWWKTIDGITTDDWVLFDSILDRVYPFKNLLWKYEKDWNVWYVDVFGNDYKEKIINWKQFLLEPRLNKLFTKKSIEKMVREKDIKYNKSNWD